MTVAETAELLRKHDDYIILTHKRPDGDTMGSAAALCRGLRLSGKKAYIFPNPQFKDSYEWICEPYLPPKDYEWRFVISVDTAHAKLITMGFEGDVDLCIDHHPSNSYYAHNTLLKSEKAACGEIVMELLLEMNGSIDKVCADALYTAISTDTGCFVYGNTTGETLQAAADLCAAGASNAALNKILFRTSSKARLNLEAQILSQLRYYHQGKTVFAPVTLKMLETAGAVEKDCADIAAIPGRAEGAVVSALIRETEDSSCRVSLRTNGTVNANDVCARFGGGGHSMAAGCYIDRPIEEAMELLNAAVEEAMA